MMLPFRSRAAASLQLRFFSLSSSWGNAAGKKGGGGSESMDDFERRIFGDLKDDAPRQGSFFDKLDSLERSSGFPGFSSRGKSKGEQQFDPGFSSLNDGMEEKLKKAAVSFTYDEMFEDNYKYRPDATFYPGQTYDVKDLDLTVPVTQKFVPRKGFYTTTREALKKADFRNVRYLANFITDAGLIIKRKKTGISAKAQRKISREIKTARAFGLMPFTSMGAAPFSFGRSAKESDLTLQYAGFTSNQLDEPEAKDADTLGG